VEKKKKGEKRIVQTRLQDKKDRWIWPKREVGTTKPDLEQLGSRTRNRRLQKAIGFGERQ